MIHENAKNNELQQGRCAFLRVLFIDIVRLARLTLVARGILVLKIKLGIDSRPLKDPPTWCRNFREHLNSKYQQRSYYIAFESMLVNKAFQKRHVPEPTNNHLSK